MQKFKTVDELISQLKPERPIYCIRKKSIHVASKTFQNKFQGKILYAVKTNPHPEVLKTIVESGIKNFDVASIKEIEDIRKIDSGAKCSYMHTVKSRESINEAYFKHGINNPDSKLRTYRLFKSSYNMENNIMLNVNKQLIYQLARFRISNHCLAIERGRFATKNKDGKYTNTPTAERLCKFCT